MKSARKVFLIFTIIFITAFIKSGTDVHAACLTVMKEGAVSSSLTALAEQELESVPAGIQLELLNRGWKACVTDRDLNEVYFHGAYGKVMGVTCRNNSGEGGTVRFENRENAIRNCVPHEIGHAVDFEMGFISETPEFVSIYAKEALRFYPSAENSMRSHLLSSSREYFAALFDEYCRNPEKCRRMVPESFRFIERAVAEFIAPAPEEVYKDAFVTAACSEPSGTETHSEPVIADGWHRNEKGWWYNADGSSVKGQWVFDDGYWYYLKNDGYMATGWLNDNGTWYYLNPEVGGPQGSMMTGWILDGGNTYYLDASGAMVTGVVTIEGTAYHFDEMTGALMDVMPV